MHRARALGTRRYSLWRWLALACVVVGALQLISASSASAATDTATVVINSPTSYQGNASIYGGKNENEPVTATVTAKLGGVPVNNDSVTWSSTGDVTFSPSKCTTSTGTCTVSILPGATKGVQTVTASVSGLGFSASGQANLMQFIVSSTTLSLGKTSLSTDGTDSTPGTITVTDASSQGVPGLPVAVSTNNTTNPLTCAVIGAPNRKQVYPTPTCTAHDQGTGTYDFLLTAPPPAGAPGAPSAQTETAQVPWGGPSASQAVSLTNVTPRLTGPFTASGTQILQGSSSVIPEGANWPYVDTVSYSYDGKGLDKAFLNAYSAGTLFEAGANFVRIPVSSDLWLQNCSAEASYYDKNYQQELSNEVNLVTSYGMMALVDFHTTNPNCQDTPNQGNGYAVGGGPSPLPSVSDASAFWSQVANKFAGNPLVAFELYNEPWVCTVSGSVIQGSPSGPCSSESNSESAWLNGGTMSGTNTYSAAGMQALYGYVRAQAPSNLVFVDSNNFASNPADFQYIPASFANVVYVIHDYPCQGFPSATCYGPTPESPSSIESGINNDLTNPATHGAWPAPMVIDEFGFPQGATYKEVGSGTTLNLPSGGQSCTVNGQAAGCIINNIIAYLQQKGVGWAVFQYSNSEPWEYPSTGSGCAVPQSPNPWGTICNTYPWQANADGNPVLYATQGNALTEQNVSP